MKEEDLCNNENNEQNSVHWIIEVILFLLTELKFEKCSQLES
jgi:hypothetical protein